VQSSETVAADAVPPPVEANAQPSDAADSLQRALHGVQASAHLELAVAASRLDELHRELKSALADLDRS
jgi:hypothetical protein